jgi:hypothetical protein
MNSSNEKINLLPTSNSSFNLNSNNDNANISMNSGYEDDDVFAGNCSMNSSLLNNNNSNQQPNLNNYNLDPITLAVCRELMSKNSNLNDFINDSGNLSINAENLLNKSSQSNSALSNSSLSANHQNQLTLALLKQKQNALLNSRLNANSNVAALTSATSNIAASLLNTHQNHQVQGSNLLNDPKRRVNSIAASYNLANNAGLTNQLNNNSSLFNTSQVGPNASLLLQNSSLASSARLNSSTTNSAAVSILGNNSSLLSSQLNQSLLNNNSMNYSNINSSNSGLLSALSLQASNGSLSAAAAKQLANSSSKPLRSERLPSQFVDELVKQAKIRRKNGGKKEVCVFCRNNGETEQIFTSHTLKDANNNVACPILRMYQCPICHASGDQAHTIKYCPYANKESACMSLFKDNNRMLPSNGLLLNPFVGTQTPPSPPSTPPMNHGTGNTAINSQSSSQLNFLNQGLPSPNTPSTSTFNFTQAFNNLNLNKNMNMAHTTNILNGKQNK